ncbi:glycosyltransferase family 4 protein [Sphingobacterium siyangense]|uniref:glycosyltransferase family 4 protein n=1 Tax=Sphingobacterium siyangense TaxID=459529 RepID=UPI003DA668AD
MKNNKNIGVVISTGQGRLHLIESARYLLLKDVNVKVITGWIPPKWIPNKLIDVFGRLLLGRRNLSYGLNKRRVEEIVVERIKTCSLAEFYIQFLFLLSQYGFIKRDRAAVLGWKFFGKQSKGYLGDVDILHVRSGAGQGGLIAKAQRMGIKVLVDHSIAHPQEVYNQLLKASGDDRNIEIKPDSAFWKLVLKDCQEADAILVNSYYVKESFVKYGYSGDNIFVAELGVREDFLGLKLDWSIKNKKIKLLFTGGFGRRKGAHIILECMEILVKNNMDFQLDILGSVVNDFIVPEWVKNCNKINFHGHVPQDQLKKYLTNADLYIFPSYSEGAAQSLKEAMAAGLPVIATMQSGAPITHLENGIVINDNSTNELYNAIIMLKDDDILRNKIGKNAKNTIEGLHTWDKYAEKVKTIYTYLIDGNGE